MIKEDKISFLQKYKTKELIYLIKRFNNKEVNKKEQIISISIVIILSQRYKTYQTVIKKHSNKSPSEIIDEILFSFKSNN